MDTHTARAHRRTLAAVVVAALGATTLAACGGDAGASEAGENPTITQFYHQYGEEGVQEAVTAWPADNGSENVDVQWVTGDYGKRITALLLAGAGIDLFENNVIDVASAREGKYADLTALIEPIADQFNPTALKAVTIDGKYYGVPMIADSQLLLYRPSMFAEAGVEVPTTWEEFVAATRALTTDDHKGAFLGNDGGAAVIASNGAAAAGTGVMNDDQTE
ncbi:MAG: extracellular solute-binding protein, partial [Cellulomonadaceae bacterium]|nr:extracellular solute-binding protein [Cellulomonadaceae bacterium]